MREISISQLQNINSPGCDHVLLFSFPSSTHLFFKKNTPKVPPIQIEIHPGSHNAIATGWLFGMGCNKILEKYYVTT